MNNRRIIRFISMVHATYQLTREQQIAIVRARGHYTALYRAAALRHIVETAPLEVTGSWVFADRRRRVRRHYGI